MLHNINLDKPLVFQTRWAMSYLRRSITRPQVQTLMKQQKVGSPVSQPTPLAPPLTSSPAETRAVNTSPVPVLAAPILAPVVAAPPTHQAPDGFTPTPPALDPDVTQVYLPIAIDEHAALRQATQAAGRSIRPDRIHLTYEPAIVSAATVRFNERKRQIDEQYELVLLAPIQQDQVGGVDLADAERLALKPRELLKQPEFVDWGQVTFFTPAPEQANSAKELKGIQNNLAGLALLQPKTELQTHETLGLTQNPGESERSFRIRLQQAARERRDEDVDKLVQQYTMQVQRLQAKLRKETQDLAEAEANIPPASSKSWSALVKPC